jgi:protoheme IX farnesyltransferase
MVGLAWRLRRCTEDDQAAVAARRLFGYSILYLFILFAVLLAETAWVGLAGRVA